MRKYIVAIVAGGLAFAAATPLLAGTFKVVNKTASTTVYTECDNDGQWNSVGGSSTRTFDCDRLEISQSSSGSGAVVTYSFDCAEGQVKRIAVTVYGFSIWSSSQLSYASSCRSG